jgi:hypothetical protein
MIGRSRAATGQRPQRQKRAFAQTAALHKYTVEPLVCPAADEIADGTRNP